MSKLSVGILLYRFEGGICQVLLVHPGGPFWVNRDNGAWSIPKGLSELSNSHIKEAIRELQEETGCALASDEKFIGLGRIRQSSKKVVQIWGVEKDFDTTLFSSNTFQMEWPRNSGQMEEFPEVDRIGWFGLEEAKKKILNSQIPFLIKIEEILNINY